MIDEQKKLERGAYIQKVIKKYTETEPALSYEELAYVILEYLDADKFIKCLKKEAKNKF